MFIHLDTLKTLTIGDFILSRCYAPPFQFEEILSIEHNYDHFRKSEEYEYLRINGMNWRYEDICGIVKIPDNA